MRLSLEGQSRHVILAPPVAMTATSDPSQIRKLQIANYQKLALADL